MANGITRTAEEELAYALEQFEEAAELLEEQRRRTEVARGNVQATANLTGSAERQLAIVKDRHRVLRGLLQSSAAEVASLRDRYDELERAYDTAAAELDAAERVRDAVKRTQDAGTALIAAAGEWSAAATAASTAFRTSLADVRDETGTRPRGKGPAAARNRLEALEEQLAQIVRFAEDIGVADRDLRAAGADLPEIGVLRERLEEIDEKRRGTRDALDAAHSGVDPAEVARAEEEFLAAERALRELPEAQRRAQAELSLAEEALDEATRRFEEAMEALTDVERLFIERIDIGETDVDGILEATVTLKQDVPPDYELRWNAGGPLQGSLVGANTGVAVHIDTRQLPSGIHDGLEVRVVRNV